MCSQMYFSMFNAKLPDPLNNWRTEKLNIAGINLKTVIILEGKSLFFSMKTGLFFG